MTRPQRKWTADSGEPNKLLIRTPETTEGKVQEVLATLRSRDEENLILGLMANSSAFRGLVQVANSLVVHSPVPATDREVVVLHLAARGKVTYEWSEHVILSERAGISDAQRTALQDGGVTDISLFSESQLLAVALSDEMQDEGGISDSTWSQGWTTWGPQGLMDLVIMIAHWGGFVPAVIRALGLE